MNAAVHQATASAADVESLLTELAELGVRLSLRGDQPGAQQLAVSAPKGSLSEAVLARIKQHKPQLIQIFSDKNSTSARSALPIIEPDPAALHQPFPLADIQTSFLMGENPSMELHMRPHCYMEFEFTNLDVQRMEKALNTVLAKHAQQFVTVVDNFQQQILPKFVPVKLDVLDLRSLSAQASAAQLEQQRQKKSRHILPLDKWPWFDCGVVLYGTDAARFYYNNNNVLNDGYSAVKMLEDVWRVYDGASFDATPTSLSYRDCVLALESLEHTAIGVQSKKYWLDRLPQLPTTAHLPQRPGFNPHQRAHLERRSGVISAASWNKFKDEAKKHRITAGNAVLAAYAEVVATWSGSRYFLFNNMATHRFPMHQDIMEVFGNFSSLYPLEIDWRGEHSFAQRVTQLQLQVTMDMQHMYWSGVKVLQALNQVQKNPGKAVCPLVVGNGLFMKPFDPPTYGNLETSQVTLDHEFWEIKDGSLWFVWDVMENAFPEGMVDAMWAAYMGLIERLANDPEAWQQTQFDLLPIAQKTQRQQLNATAAPLPTGLLHEGLARSAHSHPQHTALVTAERSLSYAQLYAEANQLAHALRAQQVRPGSRIALLVDKSWHQMVGAYGILHAGCAYVPLDPAWPADRIAYVLQSIEATHVVTRLGVLPQLSLPSVAVLCVDDAAVTGAQSAHATTALPASQQPSDLAYIIFTSGSTGVPKGVMIDHQGALNTVRDINHRFGVGHSDVLLGISALYFDLSVYDVFGAADAAATLVLPSAVQANPNDWLQLVRQHSVTVWNSVPALVQLLVDAAQTAGALDQTADLSDTASQSKPSQGKASQALHTLRTVMMSGDWIAVTLPPLIKQVAPQAQVISMGGATEASIWSIYHPIYNPCATHQGAAELDSQWPSVPYGKPLANQTWHVLDDQGRDAPTWVPGHLHIGGKGLAMGYWRDEAKTNAAFITHPHTGERLYKTGDLGRYWPDGNIEFLGRADFQVKLNGYRVELGEIEQVLLGHASVHSAAVLVHSVGTGSSGSKQLLAFVVPHVESHTDAALDTPFNVDEVLAHLRSKLPSYMVPSSLQVLRELPLTANGKLDRQALAKLAQSTEQVRKPFTPARSPLEAGLVSIWQEVLGLPAVSVHDDFFDLGGQSFAAVRVMTRVAQQYDKRLPLSTLLEGRTIAHLAQCIQGDGAWSPLVAMNTVAMNTVAMNTVAMNTVAINTAAINKEAAHAVNTWTNGVFPCFLVHPAGGNVLCYRSLVQGLAGLQRPMFGLQAAGLSGEQAPLADIPAMAALYIAALRQAQPQGPYTLGGWSSGGVIVFEMARQLEAAGQVVAQVITLDSPAPMQHDAVSDAVLALWFLEDLNIGYVTGTVRADEIAADELSAPSAAAQSRAQQLRTALALAGQRLPLRNVMDVEHLLPIFEVFCAIIRATRSYTPSKIAAPMLVIKASENRVSEFIDHPDSQANDWGWSRWTSGAVSSHLVGGNHYSMFEAEHLPDMLGVLNTGLQVAAKTAV
jgi:amino acid adenylation domain-containing protein